MGKERGITLRVRYKDNLGARSKLMFIGGKNKKIKSKGKKLLRIQKVSQQELHHVGEFNDMPERLMKEFRRNEKNGCRSIMEDEILSEVV